LPFPLNKLAGLLDLEQVEKVEWDEHSPHHASVRMRGAPEDEPKKLVIDPEGLAEDKLRRREFAAAQEAALIARGFSKEPALRVMRAAGPGLAVAAVDWAARAVEGHEWGSPHYDMALILLEGALSRTPGGCDRTAGAFHAAGLPEIEWGESFTRWNAANFGRFLSGARSALLSGVFGRRRAKAA
jgi:hypothetical protein